MSGHTVQETTRIIEESSVDEIFSLREGLNLEIDKLS